MNIKTAALLALFGAILLTILLAASLIRNAFGVAEGYIPAVTLVQSIVYTFAGFTAALFLYVVHKRQS